MNISLYQIAIEHKQMVDKLMDVCDEEIVIADTIEAESYPLETKAQQVSYAIKNMEALAESIKKAELEMYARRKNIEKRIDNIKKYLMNCMEVADIQKIECPHFAISLKKNPPKVEIVDANLIPDDYYQLPKPVLDKQAIKLAINSGLDVPGAVIIKNNRIEIK
jgi:hypothetical protein